MTLGWRNVKVIHLNDSKLQLNSKRDKHADICCGEIGDCDGFRKFIRYCSVKHIPLILETPTDNLTHKEQIEIVRKWITDNDNV